MANQEYYSLITNAGISKIIKANTTNEVIRLTKMQVGDSDYEPTQSQTSLQNSKYELNLNSVIVDETNANQFIVEGVISSDVGGFAIREVGIFCDDGSLFAIAKVPYTYKPSKEQGSAKDLVIKITIAFDNSANLTIQVDNNIVLATRSYLIKELSTLENKINLALDAKLATATYTTDKATFATKTEVTATLRNQLPNTATALDTTDLDTLTTPGYYQQNSSAAATTARHYPVALAGFLDIRTTTTGKVAQIYTAYDTGATYWRDNYGGAFDTAWTQIAGPIVQTTGTSTTNLMSQKAITDALATKQNIGSALGVGQTWQDMTSQRVAGTIYTNTTGKPIFIFYRCTYYIGTSAVVYIGGFATTVIGTGTSNNAGYNSASFIVPSGSTYRIVSNGSVPLWLELR